MRFAEVDGHDDLKHKLVETIRHDRVSHSQLFFGPEGNGGLLLAMAFAQYLLCDNPTQTDSCGQCVSCRQVQSFNYPDIHYVYPVAKTAKSGDKVLSTDYAEDWHNIIREDKYFGLYRWLEFLGVENKQAQIGVPESEEIMKKLSLKSYSGKQKILIMWMPERMNVQAANKLLKLLEEPPQKTLFLLVGEDPERLLNTITSRCQKVYIPKYDLTSVHEFLQKEEQLDSGAAGVIARISEGNMAQAKRLAERSETYRSYATLFSSWVRACYSADVKHIIDWAEECGRFEREKIKDFLTFCSNTFRDSFNIHYGNDHEMNAVFKEINFELKKFSPFTHLTNTPKILDSIDGAAYDISRNANPRLVLTDLSLNMARHLRIKA